MLHSYIYFTKREVSGRACLNLGVWKPYSFEAHESTPNHTKNAYCHSFSSLQLHCLLQSGLLTSGIVCHCLHGYLHSTKFGETFFFSFLVPFALVVKRRESQPSQHFLRGFAPSLWPRNSNYANQTERQHPCLKFSFSESQCILVMCFYEQQRCNASAGSLTLVSLFAGRIAS